MRVIRVEHWELGVGPFMFSEHVYNAGDEYDYEDDLDAAESGTFGIGCGGAHPTPYGEGMDFEHYHVCGCVSVTQLRHWFDTRRLRSLFRGGFVVRVYDVPDDVVMIGLYQVAYDPTDATLVREIARAA